MVITVDLSALVVSIGNFSSLLQTSLKTFRKSKLEIWNPLATTKNHHLKNERKLQSRDYMMWS